MKNYTGKVLKKSRKALGLSFIAIFIFMALFIFILNYTQKSDINIVVGENVQSILQSNQNAEEVASYIDQSLKSSTKSTVSEFQFDLQKQQTSCGEHVHQIYLSKDKQICVPDFELFFKQTLDDKLQTHLSKFKSISLMNFQYSFDLTQTYENQQTNANPKLNIKLIPQTPIQVPIVGREFQYLVETMSYPVGPLGGCGEEKIVNCQTNDCIADVAIKLYNTYMYAGNKYPYVWGGMSPYAFADSTEGGKCSNMFEENYPPRNIPGSTDLMIPGFDCSGWVWWVGKHANISQIADVRLSAHALYEQFKEANNEVVWEKTNKAMTPQELLKLAKPGDIIFTKKDHQTTMGHVMVYVGNNEVIHSFGGVGLVKEPIRNSQTYSLYPQISAIVRYLPLGENVQTQQTQEVVVEESEKSCSIYFDSTAWSEDAIRSTRQKLILNEFNSKIAEYDSKNNYALSDSIKLSSQKTGLSEEFVRSIIYLESVSHLNSYLSGTEWCQKNKAGTPIYCGLMQVGESACKDDRYCDWNVLKNKGTASINGRTVNHLQLGVETGIEYLNWCNDRMISYGYVTKDKPNYYFTALCYNSGHVNARKTLENAVKRSGKTKESLDWSDVKIDDFKSIWTDEDKQIEKFEYPNLMGKLLSAQCDSVPQAIYLKNQPYSQNHISITSSYATTANIDLKKYDVLEQFISYLANDCLMLSQTECIDKAITKFSNTNSKIIHTSDYTYIHPEKMKDLQLQQTIGFFSNLVQGNFEQLSGEVKEWLVFKQIDSFRSSFVDQMIDCQKNEQEGCICPIYLDTLHMNPEGEMFQILPDFEGNYYVKNLINVKGLSKTNPSYPDLALEFNPLKFIDSSSETNLATSLTFKFTNNQNKVNSYMDFEIYQLPDILNPSSLTGNLIQSWDVSNNLFALYKTDKNNVAWYYYQDKETDPPICYSNKKNQRFIASFKDHQNVSFTAYVEDKISPTWSKLNLNVEEQLKCINTEAVLVSFNFENLNEDIYAFNLYLTEIDFAQNEFIQLRLDEKEEFSSNLLLTSLYPLKLNKLYYNNQTKQYYVMTDGMNDLKFEKDKNYQITITTTDQFNNANKLDEQQITIKAIEIKESFNLAQTQINAYLSSLGISDPDSIQNAMDLICGESSILETNTINTQALNILGGCCKRYVKEVKLNEPILI